MVFFQSALMRFSKELARINMLALTHYQIVRSASGTLTGYCFRKNTKLEDLDMHGQKIGTIQFVPCFPTTYFFVQVLVEITWKS